MTRMIALPMDGMFDFRLPRVAVYTRLDRKGNWRLQLVLRDGHEVPGREIERSETLVVDLQEGDLIVRISENVLEKVTWRAWKVAAIRNAEVRNGNYLMGGYFDVCNVKLEPLLGRSFPNRRLDKYAPLLDAAGLEAVKGYLERYIFHDAWGGNRPFFYHPTMEGA